MFIVLFLFFASCRALGENIMNKIIVSPCICDVHVTCLEQSQPKTKSYFFKMVTKFSTFEWLPERRNCQEITVMLFSITIWCSMIIACGVKAVEFATNDKNVFPNGLVMSIIAFSMAAILWLWLIIFSSICKRMNMVKRMNKNYLNVADDINTAFAV